MLVAAMKMVAQFLYCNLIVLLLGCCFTEADIMLMSSFGAAGFLG